MRTRFAGIALLFAAVLSMHADGAVQDSSASLGELISIFATRQCLRLGARLENGIVTVTPSEPPCGGAPSTDRCADQHCGHGVQLR
jgi:hypothetical protein